MVDTSHDSPGTPADDHSWQQRARMALAAAAAGDRLVTYAELADAAGITGKHRINRLTGWLEAELEHEVGARRDAVRVEGGRGRRRTAVAAARRDRGLLRGLTRRAVAARALLVQLGARRHAVEGPSEAMWRELDEFFRSTRERGRMPSKL